ncbi:hypothetical protein D3C80_1642970 [compost metagenome]
MVTPIHNAASVTEALKRLLDLRHPRFGVLRQVSLADQHHFIGEQVAGRYARVTQGQAFLGIRCFPQQTRPLLQQFLPDFSQGWIQPGFLHVRPKALVYPWFGYKVSEQRGSPCHQGRAGRCAVDFLYCQCGTQTLPVQLQLPLPIRACQGAFDVGKNIIQ